jgi:predicted membrane GTPase involved in stress response
VEEVENEIFDLFCSLDASDEILDYPVFYTSAKVKYEFNFRLDGLKNLWMNPIKVIWKLYWMLSLNMYRILKLI